MLELLTDGRIYGQPKYYLGRRGDTLMQVPDEVRKCVVFIGYKESNVLENITYGATAFFISQAVDSHYSPPGENLSFGFLITAKHNLLRVIEKSIDGKIYIRINLKKGGFKDIASDIDDWVYHESDSSVDVVALPVFNMPLDEFDYSTYGISVHTQEEIDKLGIGIGDEVFLVGLFWLHKGTKRNIPIVRVGNIAAMPEELVQTRLGNMEAYLVESRSIGGLSGSPVFVHLGYSRLKGREWQFTTKFGFILLGLMQGHWEIDETQIDIFTEDNRDQPKVNMGIAIVVPLEKIVEVINQPKIEQLKKEAIEKFKEKGRDLIVPA
jgi:hypothetical protein